VLDAKSLYNIVDGIITAVRLIYPEKDFNLLIYVISKNNNPLMPTNRFGRVRRLLKDKMAKVISYEPFVIQLLYDSEEYVQPITIGVDAGSKTIGISVSTETKELFVAEVQLRNDIVNLLSTKRQYRRIRRSRLRYRKPRFLNRVKSKHKGWIAPSIEQKINSHIKIIDKIHQILPISKIIVETAQFDIQKIKNLDIDGIEYQQGEQFGFWNVREYVLFRDNHQCQGKKGCKNKIFQVHHLESRKTGGNRPDNLITLCKECHSNYHEGKLKLDKKKKNIFRDASHMNIMRWKLFKQLKDKFETVECTYGYITKFNRIKNSLEKSHINDAWCISGNFKAKRLNLYFYIKKVRCHNRQIHKAKILKGGKKKLNKSSYLVKGFRLFDKVEFKGIKCFIFGRRATGYFDIRKLDGEVVNRSASYKKLKFIQIMNYLLIEDRKNFRN